jgi:hypothetical protein
MRKKKKRIMLQSCQNEIRPIIDEDRKMIKNIDTESLCINGCALQLSPSDELSLFEKPSINLRCYILLP